VRTRKRLVRERIRRNRIRRMQPGVIVRAMYVRGEPYVLRLPNGELEVRVPVYATFVAPYLTTPIWSARIALDDSAST
jgi:hypothetical protein